MQVNQSETFPFTAIAQGAGQQCLNVTITADGVRPERQTACVNVNDASGGTPISNVPSSPSVNSSDALGLNVSNAQVITVPNQNGQPETVSRINVDVTNRTTQVMENVNLFAASTDSLMPVSMTEEFIPNMRRIDDGQLIVGLPRIEPGQTVALAFDYVSTQNDPDANVLFSAASPQGGTASQRVDVPPPSPRNNVDVGGPDFGSSQGIAIPSDPAVGGPNVSDRDPVGISAGFTQRTVQAGAKVNYEFSVTNNTSQPLTNVDIDFIVPNSLRITDFQASDRSRLTSPSIVQRIGRMDPGQTINFSAETTASSIPGPATMEVRVRSNETPFPITATDQVIVN